MKRRAFALLCATLVLAGALSPAFTLSASSYNLYTARQFWFSDTSLYGYMYSKDGYIVSGKPLTATSTITEKNGVDLKNYVDWVSVTSGYISSTYAYWTDTITTTETANSWAVKLLLDNQWTFLSGRTYEFVILMNNIQFYNGSSAIAGDPYLKYVSFGSNNMATISSAKLYGTQGAYIAPFVYRCVLTPTEDFQSQSIEFNFSNNYNSDKVATSLKFNVGFSDVVSYIGNLDNIVVNPTLDNIDKQVQEIQQSLNPDVDYSKLDEAIAVAGGIEGYLKNQQDDIMSSADRFKVKKPSGVLPSTGDIPSFFWALVTGITNLQIPVSNVTSSYFNGVNIPGLIVISAGGSYLSIGGMLSVCAAIYGVRVFLHLVGVRTFTSKPSDQEGDK